MHAWRRRYVRSFPVLACVLVIASCGEGGVKNVQPLRIALEQPADQAPSPEALELWSSALASSPDNLDTLFLTLEEHFPGFAGFHFETSGALTLSVSEAIDSDQEALLIEVGRAIRETYGDRVREPEQGPRIVVRKVKHGFRALSDAYATVMGALPFEGIVVSDLDEVRNTVTIGVLDEDTAALVQKAWAQQALPSDLLHVEEWEPVMPRADLAGQVRPVPGGVRIETTGGGGCTLGFSVHHVARNEKGFISAGHCTDNHGQVDGDWVAQAGGAWFWTDKIGEEVLDPSFSSSVPGCPPGRECRKSDSAYFKYDNPSHGDLGRVARPDLWCWGLPGGVCSTTINNSVTRFTMTGKASAPPAVGIEVERVGAVTGWYFGPIINSCGNFGNALTGYMYVCQAFVAAPLFDGDSGAPVFGLPNTVEGIAWGSTSSGYAYSPVSAIEAELGAMDFY